MAFTPLTLTRISGHGLAGPSLWLYSTADAMTTVDDVDYFLSARNMGMVVGDPVIITRPTGPGLYIAYVNAVDTDGNATVSAGTTVS